MATLYPSWASTHWLALAGCADVWPQRPSDQRPSPCTQSRPGSLQTHRHTHTQVSPPEVKGFHLGFVSHHATWTTCSSNTWKCCWWCARFESCDSDGIINRSEKNKAKHLSHVCFYWSWWSDRAGVFVIPDMRLKGGSADPDNLKRLAVRTICIITPAVCSSFSSSPADWSVINNQSLWSSSDQ